MFAEEGTPAMLEEEGQVRNMVEICQWVIAWWTMSHAESSDLLWIE